MKGNVQNKEKKEWKNSDLKSKYLLFRADGFASSLQIFTELIVRAVVRSRDGADCLKHDKFRL